MTSSEIRRRNVERWAKELKIFNRIWDGLNAMGACDELGGAEYTRVRWEWEKANRPASIAVFIVEHANDFMKL